MFVFCYFSIGKEVFIKKRLNVKYMNQNTKHKYVCMYHPLVEPIYKEIEYANGYLS